MLARSLAVCLLDLLAACTGTPANTEVPVGYRYHDANHPNVVASPSPQAIYNAQHGTWLWPPQSGDWP